ncbi:coiled-coil domain-containing protein 33 [Taeniopygia guttata]|uniref:coiled-coil domain-containing protein 33 n=1 Tax=Taeniopygia guttata TaxID=59729 RepID=UPI003BB89F68
MSLPAPGRAVPGREPLRRHGNIPSLDSPLEHLPAPAFPLLPGASQESRGHRQEPDVGSHRLALQRMAGDLLSLRRRVASLEAENGHLRHSLARLREPAQLRGTDLDVLTRDELLDKLATLARELAAGAAELRALRDRVQRLQNELIRKNDREKELVLLQRRHQQQQLALSRCQHRAAKAGALERALRQQEKVIEAMERLLRERSTERAMGGCHRGDTSGPDAAAAGGASQTPPGRGESGRGHGAGTGDRAGHGARGDPDALLPCPQRFLGATEKLELLARLEEAQGRARVLDRQLQEAARSWALEQQELGMRLREREHGLALTLPSLSVPPWALPPLR